MYVCISIYIYLYIYISIYLSIYLSIYIYIHIYIYMHTCISGALDLLPHHGGAGRKRCWRGGGGGGGEQREARSTRKPSQRSLPSCNRHCLPGALLFYKLDILVPTARLDILVRNARYFSTSIPLLRYVVSPHSAPPSRYLPPSYCPSLSLPLSARRLSHTSPLLLLPLTAHVA